jgi:uncharacterized RDD family membrane protein YckC/tRNA A-37 threonylcarbamoyl transferase component Bud32
MSHDQGDHIAPAAANAVTHTAPVTPLPALRHDYSLASHQRFGHFIIVRPLGRGGMGEVYEAEDVDTGRRVALKLLRQSLARDVDRARFLREGRLAASINHEHVVYVYGSEEIDGAPVITMELAAGGNLRDRVDAQGPLPTAVAVDLILQVIDGLEATASAGILHRDVKPSNCFIAADGTIKVGDFGLSISTRSVESQLTLEGAMLGTPAFAPPEQVAGESLDVRSDIYSTGATLYFLLTGRAPFVGESLAQLIASVLRQEPESPAALVGSVSPDLALIVLRCLDKNPTRRYQSYTDLRGALLPYGTQRSSPATWRSRILASLVDQALLSLPFLLVVPEAFESLGDVFSRERGALLIGSVGCSLFYFGLLEGIWGASLGKQLLGIRVARVDQQPIGLYPALLRVLIWIVAIILVPFALQAGFEVATARAADEAIAVFDIIGMALLFATARQANGFSGLHDVLTGARVIEQTRPPARVPLLLPPRLTKADPHGTRMGPYLVVEALGATDDGHLVLGFDDVLRRNVWIHVRPPGTVGLTADRRAIGRPGRLRWLSERRTLHESWDAYDGPAGIPFMEFARHARHWSQVRFLLYDIAVEALEILKSHERVSFGLDRIWVTQRGSAVVLDFAIPGAQPAKPPIAGAKALITRAAFLALTGDPAATNCAAAAAATPLPLHAYEFLIKLERDAFPDLERLIVALKETLARPAELTRRRRLLPLVSVSALPVAALILVLQATVGRAALSLATLLASLAGMLLILTFASICSAAFFRGGLMFQLLGITIATREGPEASRVLALWRAIVAWLPSLIFVAGVVFQIPWLAVAALAVTVLGLASAALTPDRGLHDRVLGTRLVRR